MYGVVISKNYIITKQATLGDNRIVVFNAHTGDIIWESDPIYHLNSIHADSERVYVGGIRQVQAYNLDTGQFLWKGAEQGINKMGSLKVYAEGTELNVYDLHGNRVYTLDAETGQTINEIDYTGPYFVRDNIYFSVACGGNMMLTCLSAREEGKGKMLWAYSFNGYALSWPVFVKDTIFVTGEDQLLAIDIRSGNIIWNSAEANFATAMVLGNNQLYVIRNDAVIVSIDPETGKQVGIVEIAPKQDIEFKGGQVPYYTIAASDEFVAAYYSNSQELIVFEQVNNNE